MRKLALCALLLLPCVHAQAPAFTTYRNDTFHFTYRYPAGYASNADLAQAIAGGIGTAESDSKRQQMAKCITVPVSAIRGADNAASGFGLILVTRLDDPCMGETGAPDLAAGAQTMMQSMRGYGKAQTEDAVQYKLDGRDAAFVQGTVQMGPDRLLHAITTCTVVSKNIFCFLIMDTNHKLMPALIANPITFDGGTPTPLIPADRTQPW